PRLFVLAPRSGERIKVRGPRLIALAVVAAVAVASCGHRAAAPGATPKPIVAAVLPQVRLDAKTEFDAALRALKLGKKHQGEARTHFRKATELDPMFFEAWHDLGWLDASRGNFARAATSFSKALEIQPGSRETALALAESWRRAGSFKKAAKLYGERLAAQPGDVELRNRYIQVLRDAGELEEAMIQTKIALGQAGESVAQTVLAYNSLGLIYYKMNKLELAETALRKALGLDGQSAFVWNNLGLVAFARGRDQEAFLNFQKASDLDPKYVEARLNKAVIFMDCGDYKHARLELQRAVDASPGDADADTYVALGVAARGDAKWDESRRAYETALELEPEHAPALYDLGILYMEFDKDPVKARQSLAAFLEVADEDDPRRKDATERLNDLGAANQKKQNPTPRPAPAANSADTGGAARRGAGK
ncbi:MAG: tetratricopeptide repeat protein, partial [Myxococcales bacterium]